MIAQKIISAKYAAKIVSLTIAPEATLPLRSNVLAYIYNTTIVECYRVCWRITAGRGARVVVNP